MPARLLILIACLALGLPALARRAVFVDLDGVRRDQFEEAYRAGGLPNFERVLGSEGAASFWFDRATSVFPTVTMAGQASLYSGAYPARHGVVGNQWFDRDAAQLIDYMSLSGAPCVYGFTLLGGGNCRGGLANNHLQAPTLYEAATKAGKTSFVVYNQYWKGATRVFPPSVMEALAFLQGGSLDYEAFDRRMIDRAIAALEEHGLPDILTVYFTGTDGLAHERGARIQPGYLRDTVDREFGRLLDALEKLDPAWLGETLFIISADHGRTDAVFFPEDRTLAAQAVAAARQAGSDARLVSNGGMAHLYLADPAATAVVARALAADVQLATALDEVLLRAEDPAEGFVRSSGARVSEERATLVRGIASPRSGDILLLLKPDHYFGNASSEGSHHGSIHERDLAVPLVIGGGGVTPGRSERPASITQIAPTIAVFLGFEIEGAEPPLMLEPASTEP